MNSPETIAAISSAVGAAGRMIVRISGAQAHHIARDLTEIHTIEPGMALSCNLWPGVRCWAYGFSAPRSYTGEDLVEFHIPGNPVLARMILDEVVRSGARQAEAGEFTARAYFNGRMDLTQAEGVAATIAAQSEREARAARQLLAGELARRLSPVTDSVAQALALVEVGIDFTDEDITFISADQVRQRCDQALNDLRALIHDSPRFERLAHEPRIVLVGRPNAGKSTLLNALAGTHRAVVSDVAGTTRDAIWAEVRLKRGTVRIVDVAGLEDTADGEIPRQMREQALRELHAADLVVVVQDVTAGAKPLDMPRLPDLVVKSKVDLQKDVDGVSAITGEGMDDLRARLDELAFGPDGGGAGLALNARHVRAIEQATDALGRVTSAIDAGSEVVALELREALDALGGIVGAVSPDDLLGRIFSEFCIGK